MIPPLSSLWLQKFIYFDNVFNIVYFIIEVLLFAYKGNQILHRPLPGQCTAQGIGGRETHSRLLRALDAPHCPPVLD